VISKLKSEYDLHAFSMMRRVIFSILLFAAAAEAQQKPRPEGRLTAGWMGFIDESWIDHGAFGGSVRYYLTRRVAVEPELLYMIGPGADRDVMLIPHVSLDFRPGPPEALRHRWRWPAPP
jgi:hypothetical protein